MHACLWLYKWYELHYIYSVTSLTHILLLLYSILLFFLEVLCSILNITNKHLLQTLYTTRTSSSPFDISIYTVPNYTCNATNSCYNHTTLQNKSLLYAMVQLKYQIYIFLLCNLFFYCTFSANFISYDYKNSK